MGPSAPEAGFATTARAIQEAMTSSGIVKDVEAYYVPGEGGLTGLARFVKEARGDGAQLMVTGYTTIGSVLTKPTDDGSVYRHCWGPPNGVNSQMGSAAARAGRAS